MNRKAITFFNSYWQAIRELPKESQLRTLIAILDYAFYDTEPGELSSIERIVFTLIQPTIDSSNSDRENGSRGGRPKNEKPPTPTQEEIKAYCNSVTELRGMTETAQLKFYNWLVSDKGHSCQDWKTRILQWHKEDREKTPNGFSSFPQREYSTADIDELERKKLSERG